MASPTISRAGSGARRPSMSAVRSAGHRAGRLTASPSGLVPVLLACLAVAGCGGDGGDRQPSATDLSDRTFVSTKDWSGDGTSFVTPVTVEFRGSDAMSWSAACNTAGGDVEITSDRLVVGPIASTEIGCPGRRARQDRDLVAFFDSDPTWQLEGDRLTLSADSVVAVLRAGGG